MDLKIHQDDLDAAKAAAQKFDINRTSTSTGVSAARSTMPITRAITAPARGVATPMPGGPPNLDP